MGKSDDKRNVRGAAGAALAGKENPALGAKLGPEARKMAESMNPDELAELANPEARARKSGKAANQGS